MNNILFPKNLKNGDTIGIIAPSRPIYDIEKQINSGTKLLTNLGYKVVFGKNIGKHSYYSAGRPKERADDLNKMFLDLKINMILCATGGISSSQIIPYIDFDAISKNPKPLVGYSDNTNLLLSIYQQTGLVIFHGPNLRELAGLTKKALDILFNLASDSKRNVPLSEGFEVIQEGKAEGKLIGGNLYLMSGLLGTTYFPNLDNSILFWEDIGVAPAMLHQELMHLKLAKALDKVSAIVIGNLADCNDKKHKNDNRPISEIIVEVINNVKIPIIKVDSFGHDVSNFFTYPIGLNAKINTAKKYFSLEP